MNEDPVSYEKLIAEHGLIDAALARLAVLAKDDIPDLPGVILALSDLSCELSVHLAHEDGFLYSRMLTNGTPEGQAAAQTFINEFAELRHDWGLYLGEWNRDCIAGDWAHFRQETDAMIARLAGRIAAENNLLYTMALRIGVITLRHTG
jgi:hypothetical protein